MKRSVRLALIISPLFVLALLLGIEWAVGYVIIVGLYAGLRLSEQWYALKCCDKASVELKDEITQARFDLMKKGFKF